MKKTFYSLFIFILTILALTVHCGGGLSGSSNSPDGDGNNSDPEFSTVADMPAATSGVLDGSSVDASVVKFLAGSDSGMPIGLVTQEDFDKTTSLAACEMFNMTRTAISQASMGDEILCHTQNGLEYQASKEGVDIADGNEHILALDFSHDPYADKEGGNTPPELIKIKINKDADGAIVSFEMAACRNGEQEMFIKQQIDGDEFAMTSIHMGTDEGKQFYNSATVSGKLDENGFFTDEKDGTPTPKIIQMAHKAINSSEESSFNFWGRMTFQQYSDHAYLDGMMIGEDTWDDVSCEFRDLITAHMDLIDGNGGDIDKETYEIGLLELGDGALKGYNSGSCSDIDDVWDHEYTEAWTGADAMTFDPFTESSHYDFISDKTLEEFDEPEISFGDNSFDCSSEPEATLVFGTIDGEKPPKELEKEEPKSGEMCQNFMLSHEHIDCWHLIGEPKEEMEKEEGPDTPDE